MHHVLGYTHQISHGILTAEGKAKGKKKKEKWLNLGGKDFDQYDMRSAIYGGIRGLQVDPFADDSVVTECFIAAFETVKKLDFLMIDVRLMMKTGNAFNVLMYGPTHIMGNLAAAYE